MTSELMISSGVPEAVARRGVTEFEWRTLCLSLFPGAKAESVLLVIDYCRARKLDPLKKPCHIVPMEVKTADGSYVWRDVVLPGIYELRTTAHRTNQYLGHSKPRYGKPITVGGLEVPAYCDMTIYRRGPNQERIEFPIRTFFAEVVAMKNGKPNARWTRAPIQMLTKCCEAAGLREAFPDELGGQMTVEEMEGQRAAEAPIVESKIVPPKPDGYDEWLTDLIAACDSGDAAKAWADSPEDKRTYLADTDPVTFDQIKARASE